MKNNARGVLYITNDFDVAYHTEMNFPFYCYLLLQFLSLICRETQTKYAFAEMQCDGQYCLTEMENSFVGQVICRNCGFLLVSLSLSVSLFSLSPFFYFYSLLLPAFAPFSISKAGS